MIPAPVAESRRRSRNCQLTQRNSNRISFAACFSRCHELLPLFICCSVERVLDASNPSLSIAWARIRQRAVRNTAQLDPFDGKTAKCARNPLVHERRLPHPVSVVCHMHAPQALKNRCYCTKTQHPTRHALAARRICIFHPCFFEIGNNRNNR